ncbi:hypothetical protein CFter6_4744 [Collimonas fungivorans]|uniref:Uncharacterized protein n=1 Tax=Collimonas fungivorans TaxID=158899 RepID=A0A127PHX6_9BURK|nr:hypothetical protein CFter6_4744 [Collimonas fungivorans]
MHRLFFRPGRLSWRCTNHNENDSRYLMMKKLIACAIMAAISVESRLSDAPIK